MNYFNFHLGKNLGKFIPNIGQVNPSGLAELSLNRRYRHENKPS